MRDTRLFILAGFVLGLSVGLLNCSGSKCDAKSCANGCCDSKGVCQAGTSSAACGTSGVVCQACDTGSVCAQKVCTATSAGGGAGGGSGGGVGGGSGGGAGDGGTTAGTSCANAIAVTASTTGQIDTAGKRLFYKFDATAGDFLIIYTEANPTDDPNVVDTAVTLFDATGATRIASNDDAFPRRSTDSELIHRVQTTGTYCLTVEEWSSWAGQTPVARPGDTFTLTVGTLDSTVPSANLDTEPNDDAGTPQVGKLQPFTGAGADGGWGLVYGGLDTAADVDVYRFTAPPGSVAMGVSFPPNGPSPVDVATNSYGSTLERFAARVTATDGTVVGAMAPPSPLSATTDSITLTVAPGQDYLLYVERPAGLVAGANDFYASLVDFSTDNPPELETTAGANDTTATAEAISQAVDSANPKARRGFLVGHLTPAGTDVDVYSFTATANDTVVLACGSLRNGSGLHGATFEILSATASLQTETEVATRDIVWAAGGSMGAVAITATGTYYLKVSAASQDAVNTGNFYRCGVHVFAP